jgi:site-specific recombinase XerD
MFDKVRYRLVFNRKGKLNLDGRSLVQVECLLNGKRIYFSTKVYLYPYQWDGHYIVNHPLAKQLNQYIFDELIKIQRIEFGFIQRGKNPTLAMLKNAVRHNISSSATFRDFVTSINEHSSSRGKHTKDSYNTLIKIVDRFHKDLTLEEIDIDWLNRFVDWQKSQKMSQSTISGRLKGIRCIINEAIARKLICVDDDPFLHFPIPKIKSREESLTFDEVRKLEHLKLKKREARIRDCALMAIYTGLRYHDLTTLTSDMLLKEHGKTWLIIQPKKTSKSSGVVVRLPLYSLFGGKALALIERRGSIERLTHIGNNASANRTLKDLIKRIGVADSRHITFHTLRHTFCTLLIAKGVPITTVSKLAGHTKIEQTQRYAHIAKTMIANDVKKAFKVATCDTGDEISDEKLPEKPG